jgi:hypothetical protein
VVASQKHPWDGRAHGGANRNPGGGGQAGDVPPRGVALTAPGFRLAAWCLPLLRLGAHRSKSSRESPLWSMPGEAKTTEGPAVPSRRRLHGLPPNRAAQGGGGHRRGGKDGEGGRGRKRRQGRARPHRCCQCCQSAVGSAGRWPRARQGNEPRVPANAASGKPAGCFQP